MTSVLTTREEMGPDSSAKTKGRQQAGEKANSREERRLFLDCSRENLSISDIEQGFNKNGLCIRVNKHVILCVFTIVLVSICIIFESFNLSRVLDNRRDIEVIKQDLETLRRQFYDENFLDRLMEFEDKWYEDGDEDESNQDLEDDEDSDDEVYEDYEDSKGSPSSPSDDEDAKKVRDAIRKLAVKRTEELKKSLNESLTDFTTQSDAVKENQRHKRFIQDEKNYGSENHANPMKIKLVRDHENFKNSKEKKSGMDKLQKIKRKLGKMRQSVVIIRDENKRRHYRTAPDDYAKKSADSSRGLAKRHLRMSRQIFAAHYGADSSLFSAEDEHTGNGRARHNEGVFKAWRSSDWMNDFEMERHFALSRDGKLTVYETGLYLIYAQIHYLDEHDENGYHLLVNGRPILQCMVYSPGISHKSRSCFSSQVAFLNSGDHLIIKDIGGYRYTLFQKDKSFFGLVKLGELKGTHQISPTPSVDNPINKSY